MYQAYFGLRDLPFAITPDPSFLFLSPHHQEALAHLLYGTQENGGFVQLTGEVGTGKTTLIRSLLAQQLDAVDIALCLNPRLTVLEFVASVCDELGVIYPPHSQSLKPLLDALNAHLLAAHAQGRQTVLIIDEAQNLSQDVLEQVRLLTNLETHRHKLLRIILVGQPELQPLLARPELRQLAQRITARYHLPPLGREEAYAYITHRLKVAGGNSELFTPLARRAVYRWSQGIPRLINIICDRALLGAYVTERRRADRAIVNRAAREVLYGPRPHRSPRPFAWLTLTSALAVGLALGLGWRATPLDRAPTVWDEAASAPALDAAAPLAAPDPPAPDFAALLASVPVSDDALRPLLRLWGEPAEEAAAVPSCEHLYQARNLRCLSGQADWAELRAYNLPAALRVLGSDGEPRAVLLRNLGADHATVELNGHTAQVALAQLDALWTGEYLLLWRAPLSQALIGPGSRGEPVAWLRRQLARVDDQVKPQPEEFDAQLQEQVRRFQRSRALEADGVVGVRTMLLLNNLDPAPGTPLLSSPNTGKV